MVIAGVGTLDPKVLYDNVVKREFAVFKCEAIKIPLEQQRVLYEREEMIMTAYLIVCPLVFLAGLVIPLPEAGDLFLSPDI